MGTRSQISSLGVELLLSNHTQVRILKKNCAPSNHGHKVWPTSWLLIDYLRASGFLSKQNILEIGCGWGLSGIYCAKNHKAKVTSADEDVQVYPYVKLLAEINKVDINFVKSNFDQIGRKLLKHIDVVIGTDICFCDTLIDPLRRLINRAKNAHVNQMYIADPGRWPFDDLADLFLTKRNAELVEWKIARPVKAQGRILKLDFSPNKR